jgi:hypothetical protein
MPNILSELAEPDNMSALVEAHWSEFVMEQILLSQLDHPQDGPSRRDMPSTEEAAFLLNLQLILHKLDRARTEVDVYSDVAAKAAGFWTRKKTPRWWVTFADLG